MCFEEPSSCKTRSSKWRSVHHRCCDKSRGVSKHSPGCTLQEEKRWHLTRKWHLTRRRPDQCTALRVDVYGPTYVWLLSPWDRSCTWGWDNDTWTPPKPRFCGMNNAIPGNLKLTGWSPCSWGEAHSQILHLTLAVTPGSKKKRS